MRIKYAAVLVAALAVYAARTSAQAPKLEWGPAPAIFPAGAKMVVRAGDPSKAQKFTVRLGGYTIPAHFHPTDEHVTVISGTFLVGMGDKFDLAKTMTLPAGGFVTAGANTNHFARAKGHTVVQVHAMGPFALTYANPADDPTRKVAAKR